MLYSFDGKTPRIGAGTYVSETATVIGDVTIGENCYIGHGAILRGDYGRIEIGPETAVEEGVIIHAAPGVTCRIGRRVTFGHGAIIHAQEVGDWAVIGMGAVVSINAKIGEWAIVAEAAAVKQGQTVEPGVVAAGIPAKPVRPVLDRDRETWEKGKQIYVDLAAKYLAQPMQPVV